METLHNNHDIDNSEDAKNWENLSSFEEERHLEIDQKLGHTALETLKKRESVEQDFNATLTKIDDLESSIKNGDERIKKDNIECDGKELTVYTLDDYPFHFISHTIDYQVHPKGGLITTGTFVAAQLMVNPSFWMRPSHEVDTEANEKNGAKTLSASYIETEHNITNFSDSKFGLIYGFDSIAPGTLLGSSPNDSATGRQGEQIRGTLQSPAELIQEYLKNPYNYNEIALNRYDESGQPIKPSFLITYNNKITEFTKRHASYFNVPIINVESSKVKADYASPDKLKPILEEINKSEEWMIDHYEPGVRVDIPEWLDQSS